ncbi:MAG: WD40 repeat domain-containing protein [Planctomycetaceae bacterium]
MAGQNLQGQDYSAQSLIGADFRDANLSRARFIGADLTDADFTDANLTQADFTEAVLVNAKLSTRARRALFHGANITNATLVVTATFSTQKSGEVLGERGGVSPPVITLSAEYRGADAAPFACASIVAPPRRDWRYARMVGAKGEIGAWPGIDLFGAALPSAQGIHPRVRGPASAVNAVAFSPDGELLASGHDDGSIRLWDAATGRELQQLTGHQDYVRSVSFSPDGARLASGSDDGTIRLWEVATGRHLATLISTAEGWAAFTADGRRYKLGGNPAGSFWYLVGLCRYEPGELDPFLPSNTLERIGLDKPLLALTDPASGSMSDEASDEGSGVRISEIAAGSVGSGDIENGDF